MNDARSKPRSFLLVAAAATTLLVGVLDGAVGYRVAKRTASVGYPTVPGCVTHSRVTTDERRDVEDGRTVTKVYYGADVRFEYEVDGRRHAGRGHRHATGRSTRRDGAARVIARYPVGRTVDVHYDPRDPTDAVLEVGVTATDRWLTGVLAPANVGVAGLWGWALIHTRRLRQRKRTGDVPMIRRGDRWLVSLPRFGTAHLAWGMAMWTAIAGVFVIGFGGWSAPLVTLGAVLLAALLAAGLTFAWRRLAFRSNKWLIIDPVTREARLPVTFGRSEPVPVPFDAIESVRVRSVTSSECFEPTITWRQDGAPRSDKLAQWADAERADAFAAWLREQVGGSR